jgi:hypothetical protein
MFVVVTRMAKSISSELMDRGFEVEEKPGYNIGMAYAILAVSANIPMPIQIVGGIGMVAFILFIQYWMKISWYKKVLENDTLAGSPNGEL